MGAFDRFVHRDREAEIVGRHDEPLRPACVGVDLRRCHGVRRKEALNAGFLAAGERQAREALQAA
jgi:hypothetical protein